MPKQLMRFIFLLTLLFVGTSALAEKQWQVISDEIQKNETDYRLYQAIKLKNDMTVLLISDKEARKSSAAVSLPIGSMDEPVTQLGLAHYLEHMVLMGSKKYPQPANFSEYLSKHGGSHNASTSSTYTDFYFEVENDALKGAVDRLADALAEPLLDPTNADKERNAVNAELTMARSRDGHRMYQVRAETWNQAHPIARFSGGNLETLRDKPESKLQTELVNFYNKYYSANLMNGVIYGPSSLSDLAELANQSFGRIPNHNATVPNISVPLVTENDKGIIIHYVPAQPQKSLDFEFIIDNNISEFASKTDVYLSYLLENRSKGTLSDWLISQGLAESIDASAASSLGRNQGLFIISVSLTDKGVNERDKVIAAVFSYIDLMKNKGIDKRYFDEITKVNNLSFQYDSIIRDMEYIEQLSNSMSDIPVKNLLNYGYLTQNWDPKAIKSRLNELTAQNSRIWFIGPNEPNNKKAYFVDAPYQVDKITKDQFDNWYQLEKTLDFSLPALNPYIPDNFDLIKKQGDFKHPVQLIDSKKLRLFYMPSQHFVNEPKAILSLDLRNDITPTVKDEVTSSLLNYLSSLSLDQLRYQASIAGMAVDTSVNGYLNIRVSGYSQNLPALLATTIDQYMSFVPTTSELGQAKSWYREQIEVSNNAKAFELASQQFNRLNVVPYFDQKQQLDALDKITTEDITQYRSRLIKEAALQMFTFGNLSETQVKEIAVESHKRLGNEGTTWWVNEYYQIDKPYKANIHQQAKSTDNALSEVFIPVGYSRIEGAAITSVLAKIIKPWFYDQLRTEEQLGYAVFAFNTSLGDQWGLAFLLQSNNKEPVYLEQRYQDFYQKALIKLKTLNKDDFSQYKQSIITTMTQPPETFYAEASRYSFDFSRNIFSFDSRDKLMDSVKRLTQKEAIKFYEDTVINRTGLAFSSQVIGRDGKSDDYAPMVGWTTYETISELQKLLPIKKEVR